MPEKFEYPRIPIAPGHEACNGDRVLATVKGEKGETIEVEGVICGHRTLIGAVTGSTANVALPDTKGRVFKDVPTDNIKKL